VLHVERHRLLTDIFRQQVTRELRDGLKAAMENWASVEVRENASRNWPTSRSAVWRGSLDGYRERSDYLTHFVLIVSRARTTTSRRASMMD